MKFTYRNLGTHGALGNQLWEIASTIGIAKKMGAEVALPRWGYEPYFCIPKEFFTDDPPLECDLSGNYLQDYRYFHNFAPLVRAWFSGSAETYEEINSIFSDQFAEYTAVHVRRANNLQLPDHHPVQPVEYFEQGLDILGNPKNIIVFSDDLEWCKQQSIFKDAFFGFGNDPSINIYDLTGAQPLTLKSAAYDLIAMSLCDKFVISNSTFSWWSAYIADSELVIYPNNWYGPLVSADATLMTEGLGWTGI